VALCKFFALGACNKDPCLYVHSGEAPPKAECKFFKAGFCRNGDKYDSACCLFSHLAATTSTATHQ
jgi:hypothetical protein